MKKVVTIIFSAAIMLGLAGCAGMNNQGIGVLAGGAIGGALGSQFGSGGGKIASAVGGTLIGAALGGVIGHNMDKVDRMEMNQSLEKNRNNQVTRWKNPNNGNTYAVKPTRTYYRGDQPCRDYTTHAIIGGKQETIYGKACRMADGTWKVVQS